MKKKVGKMGKYMLSEHHILLRFDQFCSEETFKKFRKWKDGNSEKLWVD